MNRNKKIKPKQHIWLIVTLTIIVMTTLPTSDLAQPVAINQAIDAPWPMWRHNPAHTGVADSGPAPAELGLKWKFNANGPIVSSPSIAYNRVYFGSYDHNLYCIDAETGSFIWKYGTGWRFRSSPAVFDGKVYLGPDDGSVYCLDADTGALIWKNTFHTEIFKTVIQPIAQIRSSPTVVDGRVYVGSLNCMVYCLDAETGSTIWKFKTGDRVVSSPAVVGGRVFVGSCDRYIYALRESDGRLLWRYDNTLDNPHPLPSRTEVDASPCVVNGIVYIYGNAGFWHALDAETGIVKWRYFINSHRGITQASASLPYGSVTYANKRVYFVDGSYAACADANMGEIIWEKPLGFILYSSPTYVEGKVYIGSDAYIIYVFNSETGEQLSAYEIGSNIRSSSSIAYGNLYVGSGDWDLYCLMEAPPKPPKTSITAALSAMEVTVNLPIAIKGTITPAPKTAQVIATFKLPDGRTNNVSATANSDGTYEVLYSPDIMGTWTAKVWWAGNDHSEGASIHEITFTVTGIPPPPAVNIPIEYFYAIIVTTTIILLVITAVWHTNKRKPARNKA